ncbi:MAG: hypothetical protein ACI4TE_07575 [Alphaproteobacteria bacterium]
MKSKSVVFLSAFAFLAMLCGSITDAAAKEESPHDKLLREYREKTGQKAPGQKAEQPKSIWDDDSESNPYFRSSTKKVRTAAQAKAEKKPREPKRSTFKRRVYTGPSIDEINQAASKKAVENFKTFFAGEGYDIKYDNISYNVQGDTLSVFNFSMVPKKGTPQENVIPYYLTAKELSMRNFNIGEKEGNPLLEDGEMKARKVEIPVWDENAVKKGKIEISQLKMTGDVPSYVKSQGDGKLKTVELSDFRSETIINETILNNIVRSKVFAASSALFAGVELQKSIIDALKHQNLDGLKFVSARINSRNIPTVQGAAAAMTSYSARVLNTDLVLGARLEAQKDKPVADIEQLKKNAAENKAAIAAAEAEMKSK